MRSETTAASWLVLLRLVSALLAGSVNSYALTILSGPSFTPAPKAPLAGRLELTTDVDSRVSVSVTDGSETWQRDFYDYRTVHSFPLLGFKPDRDYEISVVVQDRAGDIYTDPNPISFTTDPLPGDFPPLVVLESQPDKMEPGYILFRPSNAGRFYIVIINNAGEVVWYSGIPSNWDVRPLPNGDLLIPFETQFTEVDMLGETVRTWPLPPTLPYNHEAFSTGHGTFLYLSDATRLVEGYPISSTVSNPPVATTNVWYNPVVEMSKETGQILNTWLPIDMLDPTRIGYLSLSYDPTRGYDWSHANGVIEDPRDGSIIVSLRHQDAVVKFTRSGELKWILGNHKNWPAEFQKYLLTPVGSPFEWQYGQHAPMLTPQGTLLVFDNGNYRASPPDPFISPLIADPGNYSRAVEYDINEQAMEVRQVWEYGENIPERLFSIALGDADWLSVRGNVLTTFGYIRSVGGERPSPNAPNALMARVIETTHDTPAEVVFDLAVFDYDNTSSGYGGSLCYRARRIPDLYPTSVDLIPASPSERKLKFQWNATAGYRYRISTSGDLLSWQPAATVTATNQLLQGEVDITGTNQFIRVERVDLE